jgi:hypothetical protein
MSMRRITENSASKLAASLGYSRTYRDELAQLEVPMSLYDAFYRWVRTRRERDARLKY